MSSGLSPVRLDSAEEAFWRALMRLVLWLPGRLDGDLLAAVGISVNEHTTLASLSEAPKHELRMSDLARATGLSASRMTRLVANLQAGGLVTKRASANDGRGYVARLSPDGLARLEAARSTRGAGVKALVLDHVDPGCMGDAARALWEIAQALDRRS